MRPRFADVPHALLEAISSTAANGTDLSKFSAQKRVEAMRKIYATIRQQPSESAPNDVVAPSTEATGPEDFFAALLLEAFDLAQAAPAETHESFTRWPELPYDRWDLEAAAALSAADRLGRAGVLDDDWSPAAICVGKAFESEINSSVIQAVRSDLGVRLPQCYRKYQPGLVAYVDTPQRIHLNVKRNGSWSAPMLGPGGRVLAARRPSGVLSDSAWTRS